MDPIFDIPEDLAALSAEELSAFIDAAVARLDEVAGASATFLGENRAHADLREEMQEAVDAVAEARELLAAYEAEPETPAEPEDAPAEPAAEPAAEASADDEELAAAAAELAAAARAVPAPPVVEPEPVVAAAAEPAPARRRSPARSRAAAPQESRPAVSLTAAAGASDLRLGSEFSSEREIADAMINTRRHFGNVAEGASENVPVARADWRDLYPDERSVFGKSDEVVEALVAAVVDDRQIRERFQARRKSEGGSLTASGGLCAPVTPYYNLQMISVAERPVRAALAAFNADRGGIRNARPASLAAITTGVGTMTVAQDQAGGTTGTKTCQSVDCPAFEETDVEILFHCLRFGNLGARTFPERVAQWNNLVLAAHARLGDRTLLTGIDVASTAVTANTLGLGASADLLGQILAAAAGMRSRHRMDPEAVLRVILPRWVIDLVVSDVYRSTFGRWDMTPEKFVALLRQGNVEPTFHIDSAAGKGQEFGVQSAGALLPFPPTVTWYLYPEGSFLYLDGGVLELGLVRDSVLNSTNDFEIFGESFENTAFIGVESLAVTSTLCDNGITGGTHNTACPVDYSRAS